jgi:hypothetical protein
MTEREGKGGREGERERKGGREGEREGGRKGGREREGETELLTRVLAGRREDMDRVFPSSLPVLPHHSPKHTCTCGIACLKGGFPLDSKFHAHGDFICFALTIVQNQVIDWVCSLTTAQMYRHVTLLFYNSY